MHLLKSWQYWGHNELEKNRKEKKLTFSELLRCYFRNLASDNCIYMYQAKTK